jgi:hypothetical protein
MKSLPTLGRRAFCLFTVFSLNGCIVLMAARSSGADLSSPPTSAENQPPAEEASNKDVGDRMLEGLLQMSEFFDTTLPGTLEKYKLVLDFSPRLVDIRTREFMRFPFTLRYGVSDGWEIYSGINPFSPNPLNSGFDHRWGLGEISLGVRLILGQSTTFLRMSRSVWRLARQRVSRHSRSQTAIPT